MSMARILGIGVATMDIYVNKKRMYPGGNEFNIACHAKNCGAEAGFLGVFGDDIEGKLLEETLRMTGVACTYSHYEKGRSGYSHVEIKDDGDRVFLDWNQEGVTDIYPIQFNDLELSYVKTYDVACLGRCAAVAYDKIKYLHDNDVILCYDFHAIFDDSTIKAIAPLAKYAFFSCSHLNERETKAVLKLATECGSSIAIGTRGSETLFAYDGKYYYEQEPFKVKPIDALGAGDSFIAAFLKSYIEGSDIQTSLEYAAKYASKVVMIDGSMGIYFEVE